MSDLTDAAVKQSEEGVTDTQELGGQSSTSMDPKDDDWVAVDAKDVTPEPTSESINVDGVSQQASNIQASGEKEEQDGPGDGGTAEVQEEKKVKGPMEDDGGDGEKQVEEGKQTDESNILKEQERMRVEEEERQREEERKVEEERLREEERKIAEEDRQKEEERKRAEEERQREEERKREEEEKQREEERRVEEERLREEESKRAEEDRQIEEERKKAEEERQREEERKRAEEERQREEESKREEEERQREEERKKAEEERQREEERKRAEEERQREEESKREKEERQREEERKREEKEKQREEESKRGEEEREEEERQREEERKRAEEVKTKEGKQDEDRQREETGKVEELQIEGEGTDEADLAIGTETKPKPAELVSEGTELTRRKVASKDTPSESATDQGESMVHGESKGPAPSSDGSVWIYGSIVILIVISVVIVGFIKSTKAPSNVPPVEPPEGDCRMRKRSARAEVLDEMMESLSKKFPTLDQSSLDTIGGASWAHVQEKEELVRPVVLLLVSQPNDVKANDFAEEVANVYANVYHESRGNDILWVDGDDFEDSTADQVKKNIDVEIKAALEGCARVVVIKDLDELQPCSTILFHGYCDNDGAPYKDAVFIFTMTLEDSIPEDTTKLETEKIIQEHLEQHWRQCPEVFPKDKIAAMNSRVANNIVMLN